MGQKCLKMGSGLMRKPNAVKDGGFEPKINVFKICVKCHCGGAVKNLM